MRTLLRLPPLFLGSAIFGIIVWLVFAPEDAPRDEVWIVTLMALAAYGMGFIQGRMVRGFLSRPHLPRPRRRPSVTKAPQATKADKAEKARSHADENKRPS